MKLLDRIEEKKYKNYFIVLMVAGALILNAFGKNIAMYFKFPVWLDNLGTCFIAYLYGPICGAIVGAGGHLAHGGFDRVSLLYALVDVGIGVICGWMARKGYFETFYKMSVMVAILIGFSIIVSVPLNYFFQGGYTGNQWGDGVYEWLQEIGYKKWVAAMLGELIIDFPDRYITVVITYFVIRCVRRTKNIKKKVWNVIALFLVFIATFSMGMTASAESMDDKKIDEGFYVCTVYNDRNGLPGGEANAIAFTNDGYVWVGAYSGLYQYDGVDFKLKFSDTVKNVNCLYRDDEGRLWIGTNDRGLAVMVDGEIANIVDESNGLVSNSVNCIGCDSAGCYYIGTKEKLDVIQIVGGMEVVKSIEEIDYAEAIESNEDGITVVVTNSGQAHVLKNGEYLYQFSCDNEMEGFRSATFCDGEWLLGTFSDSILRYEITEEDANMIDCIKTKELKNIHALVQEDDGKIWLSAANGVGYLDEKLECHVMNTGSFSASIYNIGEDYQGNMWFTSSRLGLLKISESVFSNIYAKGNYETDVVNAVTEWNGNIYIGSDNGLDVMNAEYEMDEKNTLVKALEGQRIRNFMIDSRNHLWISISAGDGLWDVSPNGDIKKYTEEDGMICNRFRSAIELSDGTVAVAEDGGIDFIKDGEIVSSLTAQDGLVTPMVLSLCESKNGFLYAGTDGGGLFLIKDGKIYNRLTMDEGLSSDVILRVVECENGLLVVASNGINYVDHKENVKYLSTFPFSNNYEICEGADGNIWILSGAGIYVMDLDSMLDDRIKEFALLDSKYGLEGIITANSWSYQTEDGMLFIPGDNGCYLVDTNHYYVGNVPYRMTVDYAYADELSVEIPDNRVISFSGDCNNMVLHAVVPNYTANELYVGYVLEGYDGAETIVSSKDLNEIKYSNIPSGTYRLVLHLYDESKSNILESVSYTVEKQMRIFDYHWFKFYFVFVCGVFVIWVTWMILKRRNDRIMAKEQEKLRQLERDAQISNETIMAIAKTVDAKDQRTSKHSERVAEYSVQIARALGWSEKECEDLYKTGLLHDIGKIGIPDSVLNKPGRLTDEEYALMKTHVDKGAEILKGFTIVKNVDLGTRFHHERYDGNGYPKGLKGEEIPIQARIIGIADAFDAMTSNRVYRQKLELDVVMEEMRRCSGTQFDPELTKVFLKLIEDGIIDVEVLYENE
ncbi:MAG: two-component regulator propeller domain-containing protein [Eubacteriales bacterium]|nr:two-component regulator propeller domain-containing protein [Eubacteriales bacterium]